MLPTHDRIDAVLRDPERLEALRGLRRMDDPPGGDLDTLAGLSARVLRTPVAWIALMDAERQEFRGQSGLPPPLDRTREAPAWQSLCRYVVATGAPLRVPDLRRFPVDAGRTALLRADLRAYLGHPLAGPEGRRVGTVCVACRMPREWGDDDVETLRGLAAAAGWLLRLAVRLRERTEAVRAHERVLAMVAHELRNPLHAIVSGVQLARMYPQGTPSPATDPLRLIDRAARRMRRLVTDLLEVGSAEGGHMAVERRPARAPELVRGAVREIGPLAAESDVSLRADVPARLPAVCADAQRVRQVLGNLLGNALKFTPRGGEVVVSARAWRSCVRFRVRDSGPGVAPEQRAHLFDPFWQGDPHDRRGVGLGLSIAREIVQSHGGRIGASTPPSGGTVLWFTLPLARAADPVPA